jgi:[histone H3]-lysine36 N-trimethyltransferase
MSSSSSSTPAPSAVDLTIPGFRVIEDNILKHRKPRLLEEDDVQTCDCRRGASGASDAKICDGDTCSNRATRVECLVGFCSKGRCQNMRLQRKQRAEVRVVDAGSKGRGLVASRPIRAGDVISEYTGEVLSEPEYKRRMELYAKAGGHFYIMGLGRSEYLDAARCGNFMRFMNHSCTPNA